MLIAILFASVIKVACIGDSITSGDGLPDFDKDWRSKLPRPVFDERPEFVDFYYRAWEIAHTNIDFQPGLPVPRYMDEGHRSDWIWIWDTCFMVHYTKYGTFEFPGVESLGNFYAILFPDGELKLPKVVGNRWSCGPSGIDDPWEGKLLDFKLAIPDNPPLAAWTEYRHALQSGDRARLERIYSGKRYLQRWFGMFENFSPDEPPRKGVLTVPVLRREGDKGYHWNGGRSGMDNTPRGRRTGKGGRADAEGGAVNASLLWVDAYAQQALAALSISRIAEILGDRQGAAEWRTRHAEKKAKINELYWDETDGFYYDIHADDLSKCKVPTIASYWPLLAEVPDAARRTRLIEKLKDPDWFGGAVPLPSLARKDADFWPTGGYWRGGVWMPTAYMTLKGLDRYGEHALAREIGLKIVADMCDTWKNYEPHTIWEAYSPTEPKPASYAKRAGVTARPDFCGWSALGPISIFIEDVIGIKEADAFRNELVCEFAKSPKGRVGVENYRFGKTTCTIIATATTIDVESDAAFRLKADWRVFEVKPGKNRFSRDN